MIYLFLKSLLLLTSQLTYVLEYFFQWEIVNTCIYENANGQMKSIDWTLGSPFHKLSLFTNLTPLLSSFVSMDQKSELYLVFGSFTVFLYWSYWNLLRNFLGTGISHFMALCLAVLHRQCIFYKLELWSKPMSIRTIFPKSFVHFLSLYYILVILTVIQTFSLSLCLL